MMLLKPAEIKWINARCASFAAACRGVLNVFAHAWQWVFKHPSDAAALGTAGGTLLLAIVTFIQVNVSKGQLDEMANEQRPWVYAEIDPKRPRIVLIDLPRSGKAAFFIFEIKIFNTGHLPATDIIVNAQIWPDKPRDRNERANQFTEVCSRNLNNVAVGSLFPGQAASPWSAVEALLTSQSIADQLTSYPTKDDVIFPYGIACVRYREPSGVQHITPYSFRLGIKSETIPGIFGIPGDFEKAAQTDFGVWADESAIGEPN